MQIKVYLDVIFFINFIADLFVLFLTGVILRQKIIFWRLVTGALFGAGMLLPFILTPSLLEGNTGIVICIGISMGAVAISFGRKNGGLIKKWFLSTTITFLFGGMINYLRYITGTTSLKLCMWMLLFTGSSVACYFMVRFFIRIVQKENDIYLIKVKHENQAVVDLVYLDTGNMLWDPLFRKPVIILSEDFVMRCMTDREKEIIEDYRKNGRIHYENMIVCKSQRKTCFHEIAYQSLGNPSGKLLCFLVEEISINGSEKTLKKQPVAIAPSDLFEGKRYQGLLHRECI